MLEFLRFCRVGDLANVRLWVANKKVDVNKFSDAAYSPLCYALKNGKDDVARFLVESGADVNADGCFGNYPIHFASNVPIIQLLVDHGADIHKTDATGDNVISNQWNADVVRYLLKLGVNVNGRNDCGATALLFAVIVGQFDIVKLLVEEGKADCSIADKDGVTPLAMALQLNKVEIADYLKFHTNQ